MLETDEKYLQSALRLIDAFNKSKGTLPSLKELPNIESKTELGFQPIPNANYANFNLGHVTDEKKSIESKQGKTFFSFAPLPDNFMQKKLMRRATKYF